MQTTAATPIETIHGAVEQVNERGIKLGGRWWNFSRYHAVTPPARGQSGELAVKGDFISAIAPASGGGDTADDPFAGLEHTAPTVTPRMTPPFSGALIVTPALIMQ